ncbi:MAG: hypothetical protein CM1200mP14_13320 [Gammaproteobacteria bacterium]|nr:MAG: hypothetical protein CM1200mP14_13320 [Gammaproteobacteria bacterium]
MIDAEQRLRSLVKADLVEYEVSETPTMEPTTLSSDEIADLIGYLLTLGGCHENASVSTADILGFGGAVAALSTHWQVSYDRILSAANEPENWLTYNGTYSSQRYSGLRQITPSNVDDLELKWMLQNQVFGAWQSNPIVVDGIMYVTERPNDVMAVDAVTGRVFWLYRQHQPRMQGSAVARTTVGWPCLMTRCSWEHWTPTSSRLMQRMDSHSGMSR